jgi:DNA-binding response OmpR family regulator
MPLTLPRPRILIVDSSLEMLALMSNLFRPYGGDLIVTSTADDAVRQAREFSPHAVYMGLEYPDCNGWELAARLRNLVGMKGAMLVGLTQHGRGWQSEGGEAASRFDYYFPKPPRMRDIVAAMTANRFPVT